MTPYLSTANNITRFARRMFDAIMSAIFPRRCVQCAKDGDILCDSCLATLPRASMADIPDTWAVFPYRHPAVKDLIWALKYKGDLSAVAVCARALRDDMMELLYDEELFTGFTHPVVVPIPLSARRMRERGYNQSERIAKQLIEEIGDKHIFCDPSLLARTKDGARQAKTTSKTERQKNMAGCFSVPDSSRVRGKHIILIDDVTTTGATLAEARKTLRQAGARRVICFTVAH